MSSIIIGTSGHIDHGKTTLLKAITGVSLDKSPEEKKRGITIDLGFTHLDLSSGKRISFIDVPGHERLVRTMIAGASGMDAVLLCISAVEGVMPQTREHIDILNLLGVTHGIIAITMTDLVDDELLELAEMDIEEAVAGTPFEDFPIVHTAAGEHPVGIDALVTLLDGIPPKETAQDSPFRLFIDRVFVQPGFGTVVTGTARGQSISQGETLLIHPTGHQTRVRNIQQHGETVPHTISGQRTALNLAGLSHTDITRGHVLLREDTAPATSIVDIAYVHLNGAPKLKSGTQVRFLVGSTEVLARLYLYETEEAEEGTRDFAQLRLANPVRVLPRDRVVIRRVSPVTTLGGGEIIDPFAPKLRQKNRQMMQQTLQMLADGNPLSALERCGSKGMSATVAHLWKMDGPNFDNRFYHPNIIQQWCMDLRKTVNEHHFQHPLSLGIPLRELHSQSLHFLSPKAFEGLIQSEVQANHFAIEGARVRRFDYTIELTSDQSAKANAIIDAALSANWEGISMPTENLELVHYLLNTDAIVSIQKRLVHPKQIQRLIDSLHQFFQDHALMSPVDFKGITGLSRKHAIPWLEWLDSNGITQRTSEGRKLRTYQ